jgi:hypothetical protein
LVVVFFLGLVFVGVLALFVVSLIFSVAFGVLVAWVGLVVVTGFADLVTLTVLMVLIFFLSVQV